LVQTFYVNKKFYEIVMKDIDKKKEDKILEPLISDEK